MTRTWTSCFLLLGKNNRTLTVANTKKQNTASVQQITLPSSFWKRLKYSDLSCQGSCGGEEEPRSSSSTNWKRTGHIFRHKPEQNCPKAEVSGVYRYQVRHSLTCSSGAVAESFDVLGGSCETSSPSGTGLRSAQGIHQGSKQ